MRPEEVDELNPEELWLIVILEAHAQVNLRAIRGLWGHGERMTEYIIRRGLLPKPLVDETWQKWSAPERPAEMVKGKSADEALLAEVRRLVCLSAEWYRPHPTEPAAAICEPPMSYCLKPRPNRTDVLNLCDFTPTKELVVWPN